MKILLLALTMLIQGTSAILAQTAKSVRDAHEKKITPDIETGIASYYHRKFQGRLTASGQRYDSLKMTAAHNSLPFGTRIKVTNLRNKRSVIVRVNDRLHHRNKRLVDLSLAGAKKLGYLKQGLLKVRVEVLRDHNK